MRQRIITSKREVITYGSFPHPDTGLHYFHCLVPFNEMEQRNAKPGKWAHDQIIRADRLEPVS